MEERYKCMEYRSDKRLNFKIMDKIYNKLYLGKRLSRREKKFYLGEKVSKSELKKMLKNIQVEHRGYPEGDVVIGGAFCPKCGCMQTRSTDYHVPYPEVRLDEFCARCGLQVGGQDNSLYYHILSEYKISN